jgi:hypothetical protein
MKIIANPAMLRKMLRALAFHGVKPERKVADFARERFRLFDGRARAFGDLHESGTGDARRQLASEDGRRGDVELSHDDQRVVLDLDEHGAEVEVASARHASAKHSGRALNRVSVLAATISGRAEMKRAVNI